jgi:hypothetical protein
MTPAEYRARRGPAYRPRGQPRRRLPVEIHADLYDQLNAYAAQEGISQSAATERLLALGLSVETEKPAREDHDE